MSRILRPSTAFSVAGRVKTKAKVRHKSVQACDAIFSRCVRERSDWTCQACGRSFERGAQNLHCSHFHGRALRIGRWNPSNVAAHCAACHMRFEQYPSIFVSWIKSHLGEDFDWWETLPQLIIKVRPVDRDVIHQFYTNVHAEQLRCRDLGISGLLPFGDWREAA